MSFLQRRARSVRFSLMVVLCVLASIAGAAGTTVASAEGLAASVRALLREGGEGTVVVAIGSEVARAVERAARLDGLTIVLRTAAPGGDRATELARQRQKARCLVVVEALGSRGYGLALDCVEASAGAASTVAAVADADLRAFSLSKVIYRLEPGLPLGEAWIGGALREVRWMSDLAASSGGTELRALELLRQAGLPARGGEDLLFGQDRAGEAALLLGGEVRQVRVATTGTLMARQNQLTLVVDWQIFDRRSQEVIARISATGRAEDPDLTERLLELALLDAARTLSRDPRFRAALAAPPPAAAATFSGPLSIPACPAAARRMPGDLAAALGAVLPVHADGGVGAGVLISAEGWVLTAAHVVEGAQSVQVSMGEGGPRLPAEVVRVQPATDVALLRIPGSGYSCLRLGAEAPVGTPIYAVGAPLGDAMGISVSQGIISGWRRGEGGTLLQTDASLSPGHSGGPLLGPDGTVLGVISFKVVASGVEGIGFGIPAAAALESLSIQMKN